MHSVLAVVAIATLSAATIWSFLSSTVTICSIAHTALPPWDFLSDFPRVQKVYKLLVYLVGYVAVNWRSTLYPVISTKEGTQVSPAANGKL